MGHLQILIVRKHGGFTWKTSPGLKNFMMGQHFRSDSGCPDPVQDSIIADTSHISAAAGNLVVRDFILILTSLEVVLPFLLFDSKRARETLHA